MRVRINKNKASMQVSVSIENLGRHTREALAEGFTKMGSNLVRTLQNSILNEPKFGAEYRVKGKNGVTKLHRASAAKQTPALISGQYFEKTFFKPHAANGLEFGVEIEYAEYLELGTDKMEPRPGLGNAITSSLRNSRLYLEESLDKGIRP